MVQTTCQRLRTYIDAATADAALYRELAKKAPAEDARVLLDIANDNQQIAQNFQCAYQTMSGCSFTPSNTTPTINTSYQDALRSQILSESESYRNFTEQSLVCNQNTSLQNTLLCAGIDKNTHALQLGALLSKPNGSSK